MTGLKKWMVGAGALAMAGIAHAGPGGPTWQVAVPEVGTAGGLAALTAVGAVVAAAWERRRKKSADARAARNSSGWRADVRQEWEHRGNEARPRPTLPSWHLV